MFLTNYYKAGVINAICDRCGVKFKSDELRKTWDGFMVCKDDFEYRHPQELIRGPRPQVSQPWTRPEGADRFVTVSYISESTGLQETTIPAGDSGTRGTL